MFINIWGLPISPSQAVVTAWKGPGLHSASSSPAVLIITAVVTCKVTGVEARGYLFVFVFTLLLGTSQGGL